MAKIDISKIEGYENMTAEQKIAALEGLDLPEPDYTGFVKKELFDRTSSELAGYKKQLRDRMTEEEAAKAKSDEELATMRTRLEELEREKAVSEYTTQFMGIGYSEELAKSTAAALHKGDMQTMFKNHAKFTMDREKALKAELLKATPTPPAGAGSGAIDYDKKIAEAQAQGDFSAVAYYTRLSQQKK